MNKCYISNNELDIRKITDFLNIRGIYPENAYVVAELYHEFCSDEYFAGWLILDMNTLDHFAKWIKQKAFDREDERIEYLCD